MNFPFKEKQTREKESVRIFSGTLDSHELKWHQDREDRTVMPLEETER
jgi:hypothetical protein